MENNNEIRAILVGRFDVKNSVGVLTTFIWERHWAGFRGSASQQIEEYVNHCIINGREGPLKGGNLNV